jgi:structural maintenance of chromosome 1
VLPCQLVQGDVESVSTKSPKELTALFEHISTSDEFANEYEELETKREQAVQRTMFSYQKKKQTSGERKQKKEQKEEAEKHLALQAELVSPCGCRTF